MSPFIKQWLWFWGLWLAGFCALGAVAFAIRLVMGLV